MKHEIEYLDLATVQNEELKMLKAFALFCDRHDLIYSLDCGTLLGAIRHKGFIPWDDDVDVCMPRPDYERFIGMEELFKEEAGLLFSFFGRERASAPFLKIENPHIRAAGSTDKASANRGLWIDVFPFDGVIPDPNRMKKTYEQAYFLQKYFWIGETKWALGETPFRKVARAVISPFILLFGIDKKFGRRLFELAKSVRYEDADHVAGVAWGYDISEHPLKKEDFERSIDIEFCGHTFRAMSCWDEYLTVVYGDYMQLPPEDKRDPHCLQAWRV